MKNKLAPAKKNRFATLMMCAVYLVAAAGLCGVVIFTLKDAATIQQALMPIFLFATFVVAVVLLREPLFGVSVLLALMPILSAGFLDIRIIDIAGMKLNILLPMGVMACLLLGDLEGSMRKTEKKVIVGVLILFFAAYLRSLDYAPMRLSTEEIVSTGLYLRSYMLKDLLCFLPFIFICMYFNTEKQVHTLIKAIFWGITILGIFTIIIFSLFIHPLGNFEVNKAQYLQHYMLHPNDTANMFLLAFPLMMGYAYYQKKLVYFAAVGICLVSIVVLFSRTVYVLTAVATVLFLIYKKKLFQFVVAAFVGVCSFPLWPANIRKYALTLVQGRDLNVITSGRTGQIWQPLLYEVSQYDIVKLLFGYGRFGVFQTRVYLGNDIFSVSHAHNVYLTTLLETGLVGLLFFTGTFCYYLVRFFKQMRSTQNPFFKQILPCICLSIALYLVRGAAGGYFLPSLSNFYLWGMAAIGIVVLKADVINLGVENFAESEPAHKIGRKV